MDETLSPAVGVSYDGALREGGGELRGAAPVAVGEGRVSPRHESHKGGAAAMAAMITRRPSLRMWLRRERDAPVAGTASAIFPAPAESAAAAAATDADADAPAAMRDDEALQKRDASTRNSRALMPTP